MDSDDFFPQREAMVEAQIRKRGIVSPRVLQAMLAVPRHEFVPAAFHGEAYQDKPLPIGEGQTISQPFMVAAMSQALELTGGERVLEVGTGSGYQAAVLSLLAGEVFSIESHPALALAAQQRLERLGYSNVHVHTGDGSAGFPEGAPFDAILVAAAAPSIPAALTSQLREGGHLVIPVGTQENQELLLARKRTGAVESKVLFDCRFVPLLGRHGWDAPERKPSR